MNLKQRIIRYLIGVGIGCLIVFAMFPNYDWLGWTPGKVIMRNIREARWEVSERGKCFMDCYKVTNDRFDQARFNGNVNIDQSDTRNKPIRYQLEHDALMFQIEMRDTLIVLTEIGLIGNAGTCNCP